VSVKGIGIFTDPSASAIAALAPIPTELSS